MTDSQPDKKFLIELENTDKKLYDILFKFLKVGEFPVITPTTNITIYDFAQNWGNREAESRELYNYFKKIVKDYAIEFKKQISDKTNDEIIDAFIERANRMDIIINFMKKTFSFLDFYFVKFQKCPNLITSALTIYRQELFMPYQKELTIEVNKLLNEDRYGKYDNRNKIKKILSIMKAMDLTNPELKNEKGAYVWFNLEKKEQTNENAEEQKNPVQDYWYDLFKQDTEKFISKKAKSDFQNRSTPEYINIELDYVEEEHKRQEELINYEYHKKINDVIYEEIIGKYMADLVDMDTGVNNMLENNKYSELHDLYKLFRLYPASFDLVNKKLQPYIKDRGNTIYNDEQKKRDPKKFIPELINLKIEMDKLVLDCFENDAYFQDAKNKAFSLFMKKEFYAKQLANYVDFCMRAGFKGKSEGEVETTLVNIINLFKCLESKLVFQNEANKKMSERLIKGQSLSSINEMNFITKLKQESGITYVSKMQEMITDLEKSKVVIENYKSCAHKGSPNGIKFEVTVISQSAWDINKKDMEKFVMPNYLNSCLDDFEKFYLSKHQSQKLIWCLGLSKIEISYLYLKNKNISTSTFPQLLALLALEKHGKLNLKMIAQICGCSIPRIIHDIQGLVLNPSFNPHCDQNKGIVLGTFDVKKKEFKETDEISINNGFISSKIKISTIPLPQKKSDSELKKQEEEEAAIIKRYQDNIIQATVTRIMKSRIGQKNTHVWLIGECSKQIDLFRAQPQQIKENIEKLIEKNVIKRDEEDRTCYDYIA